MPKIKVADELLYYEDSGDMWGGSTLLLLHGAGGSSCQWEKVIGELAEGHRVLALDLPGHGNSSGRGSRSVNSYVKVVRSFTAALELPNLILCGHSLGGAIAMEYALKYPGVLQALVLVSTGARLKVAPLFLEFCLEGNMEKLQILLSKYAFSPGTPLVQIRRWQKQWGFPPREIVYGDFLACSSFDRMEDIRKIKVPTLIICGDEDLMTPLKYSTYLADRIKDSKLEVIPDSGHMLMVEKPRELSRAISQFAGKLLKE